ncbi:SAM-dependent methyltransferase [Actinoplanes lutulentus]|uniref:Nodulation protein S (NodS) n=1 Tax=Actinoplanes lutulentus TaxID=1287878 RepID=A0A327ZA65_9ACTN|nr:class I SAM-dependent methyltransferase [Actinoplanes lutulentus]MBB2947188.1 SAM-dependent methyltransferase [Actinoplanes lutulentus]RAK36463.1 nodulation protein S (NodS) [Actinoplanes lutulentus]
MTTPVTYFERMYAGSADPWNFETRWYDARKHALTVAALTRPRYRSAFEPGCSTGRLTALLAGRCDSLLAVDAVGAAVRTAASRAAGQPQVTVREAAVPHEWPAESFDLIVLSEIGYYFSNADLSTLVERTVASLEPGGDLVAVHWRWPVEEHARSGDEVHAVLAATDGLTRQSRLEEADFLLEVYTRDPSSLSVSSSLSVAQREGLV